MLKKIFSILVGVILISILVGGIFWAKTQRVKKKVEEAPKTPVVQNLKIWGKSDAPIKLVEFSDFQCPSCRQAQTELYELFKRFPDKIQITYKHFPLAGHIWSLYAHQAAECMNKQSRFWIYQDKVYEEQLKWSSSKDAPVELLLEYVEDVKGDKAAVMACMADVNTTREIYEEKNEGVKLDVSATPTVFFGDKRYVGPVEIKERLGNDIAKELGEPIIPIPDTHKKEEGKVK